MKSNSNPQTRQYMHARTHTQLIRAVWRIIYLHMLIYKGETQAARQRAESRILG